jgi:adenine-specific DNA-methyltransferase
MIKDINSFKEKLHELISKFEKDNVHYLSKGYLEAQVRIDFINPFFKALGWDIENKAHKPPHERDVIVELSPETTGRPDYNFRINGSTKFFIEVKSPSVALDDINHILQAKSYAWSTKEVYFVVLTDFEEFRLYDASLKPNPRFPNEGLVFDFKYTDYLDNIERLWELSRERVEQGSLELLLPKDTKSKRLRIPPDKSFLEDLTVWRTDIAKDIHKRNPEFDVRLLNDVVQRLLDRIVFIRIAEDRKIRPDRELWEIVAQWKEEGKRKPIITHLKDLFKEVNDDLNGDIFKPHACETADVDSNLLAEIIENLYFPKSRYRFDAIGVELLGSIYERYLGSTIRVTPQRVKVEEKPEVRKAGGVYYTPKYIVDYIVKNTVGKIIEGKTPSQIEKIKILDPACGSGSFLLGAYQYLIDYHLKYYREHPKEAQTLHLFPYWKISPEELSLPIHEKAKILRNNIFGVDIDPQAVEITMMSLYLKALEGERGLLPKKQHLLPPLSNNIKSGNSLIGYDIFDNPSLSLRAKGEAISDEAKSRINPFDWNSKSTGFGEILNPSQSPLDKGGSKGGFDCVIGNPPYVKEYVNKEPFHDLKGTKLYKYYQGKMDLWYIFACLSLDLLKQGGLHSFIATNNWITNSGASILRKKILSEAQLLEFIDFGDYKVFETASIQTMVYLLKKTEKQHKGEIKYRRILKRDITVADVTDFLFHGKDNDFAISFPVALKPQTKGEVFTFVDERTAKILSKIEKAGKYRLREDDVAQGIVLPQDFVIAKHFSRLNNQTIKIGDGIFNITTQEKKRLKLTQEEKKIVKPFYTTNELTRYYGNPSNSLWVIYTTTETIKNIKTYPNIKAHLDKFKSVITSDFKPYGLHRARDERFFLSEKIVSLRKTQRPCFTYTDFPCYVSQTFFVLKPNDINLKYLVAILNSKVSYYWFDKNGKKQGNALQIDKAPLLEFPIRTIDFNNHSEKAIHDKLVSLVDRMLELHKKKNSLPPSAEREKVEREIAVTDEKIDELVYGLYGVMEEERGMIEVRGI